MDTNQKENIRILQVLLWLWFGVITSFVSLNAVNIARLETENKNLHKSVDILKDQIMILSLDIGNPEKQKNYVTNY
jgi:hypothetical protein